MSEPQSRALAQSQQELARQYQQKLQTEQQLDQVRQQQAGERADYDAVRSNLAAPATAQPQDPGQAQPNAYGGAMGMPGMPAGTSGSGAMPGGYPGQPPAAGYGNAMPGAGGMMGGTAVRPGVMNPASPGAGAPPIGRRVGCPASYMGDAAVDLVLSDEVQVPGQQAGQLPAVDFQQMDAQSDAFAVETHLASLDVDLPLRGREYLFTTPRGDIDITARAVSEPLLGRLYRLLVIAAGFVVLVVLLRVLPRVLPVLHRSRWFAAAVLLAGLLSLLLGIFPILALAALIYGLVQLIRLEIARRRRISTVGAAS